ncbi:hypothetical protein [Francisella frigiditurris]|uniref:Putative cell division protein zipA n=1 Tax=Francisella frigiditurris TaxID=1542390 RepID=A0A1J0KSF2_9GAMM|nr:hypothetical protein [Francisella frigiditurris]APC96704.1 putative cell division protein zipA [Francisella frigiditurris]
MFLILSLSLLLVVLIVIDFYRKGLRQKQLNKLEAINSQLINLSIETGNIDSDTAEIVEHKNEYEYLKQGFSLFYFESFQEMDLKDLNSFFKGYGIKFAEGIFQKVSYKDVIYSILPDNESQTFEGITKVKSIIVVMNYRKVASEGYDVKVCYESMIDMLDSLVKAFSGVLMSENKVRLTNRDKQKYLEAVVS